MKKIFFLLTLLVFIFSVNLAESQQKKVVYFEKYPDDYSPSYVPEEIIPPTAKKESNKNNEKNVLLGQLTYSWTEADPNGNECRITLGYNRHTYATTNYGWGSYKRDGITVKPEEAAYINSLKYVGHYLSDNYETVEVKNIPSTHIQNAKDSNDPRADLKIIRNLREMKTIPAGYIVSFDKSKNRYGFTAPYANINMYVDISCSLSKNYKAGFHHEFMKNKVKHVGLAAYNKLTGNPVMVEKPVEKSKEVKQEQPKQESPKVRVIAMPSAYGDDLWSIAYLPATNKLPAKIIAETKPNTPVTFHIVKSPKDAYLFIGNQKGITLETKSDSKGIAEALFYYNGSKVTQPKKYEIKVSTGEERDIATVHVGLGLAFDKIKAVQGAYGDRHPFTLSLVSKHFPKLNLGLYFSSASRKVWNGQTVGVRLRPQWVNKTSDLPMDKVFNGITKITPVMASSGGNNVLTVLSYDSGEETVYNITKYAYPAVKMMSEGIHNYRIRGELVLTDEEGRDLGNINETLIQSDALAVVSKENPEHFMVSLVCAFEAQSADQFLMLEILKKVPAYGEIIDEFLNVTGILCKFGKADYEGLFYDLTTYLGSKWIDHLSSDEVFPKLTPRQQKAVKWAEKSMEKLGDIKSQREFREKMSQEKDKKYQPSYIIIDNTMVWAPTPSEIEEAERTIQKMEEQQQKNKPIEAKFNNENLKKADEMKKQQNTQTQGSEDNVFEKAINELKDAFKKIFK